jgi:rhodanese-related sulfurtransferase
MRIKDIHGVLILVTISVILALFYNYFSVKGIALFGQWDTNMGVISAKAKNDTIQSSIEINDLDLIKQIISNKERIVLDVRAKEDYDHGHLPGAHSFPMEEFDDGIDLLFEIAKPDAPILVYCSSTECSQSHTFSNMIIEAGFSNVKVFVQGFRLWQEKGLKVEKNG